MTYGATSPTNMLASQIFINPGFAYLILDPTEQAVLESGKAVTKRSADSKGHFKITVKLTRPKTKKARFANL